MQDGQQAAGSGQREEHEPIAEDSAPGGLPAVEPGSPAGQSERATENPGATPKGYQPIATLERENHPVELALPDGHVAEGWMICGHPTPQARTYWRVGPWRQDLGRREIAAVHPLGWRPLGPFGRLSQTMWLADPATSARSGRLPAGQSERATQGS